jgi:two-component system OmpR family sensor kinase
MKPELTRPLRRLVPSRLRLRVLIAAVSVTLIALVAFDVAAVIALRGYLMNQTDTTLHTAARLNASRLATMSAAKLQQEVTPAPDAVVPPGHSVGDLTAPVNQLMVGQYAVLYWPDDGRRALALAFNAAVMSTTTNELADYAIPADIRALAHNGGAQTGPSMDGTAQVRLVAAPAPGGILVVSASLNDVNNTVDHMRLILILGSAAALLLIGVGGFWLLRRGLRPIENMATQADRITAGNLTDRVAPHDDPRSEVGRLGTALNGMLARIEASVQEREADQELMRQFFADASHELRTPLASLRANAELYQQGALPEREQVDEVMRRIGLEARRMSRLVDDMLRLARLDQHPDQQREPVRLSELVTGCVDRVRVAAPQRTWHTEIASDVVTSGDEEQLRQAVDNLLANVLTHTPEDASATVVLREHADDIEIEVTDTGPGVPDDQLPRIFDRFYRTGTARPGAGLGLAIVTRIVNVHNGTITAGPNQPHGLRVRITLTRNSHGSPATV